MLFWLNYENPSLTVHRGERDVNYGDMTFAGCAIHLTIDAPHALV
jgi:hypothetical protein